MTDMGLIRTIQALSKDVERLQRIEQLSSGALGGYVLKTGDTMSGNLTICLADAGTTSSLEALRICHTTTATAGTNFGVYLSSSLEAADGTNVEAARMQTMWANATTKIGKTGFYVANTTTPVLRLLLNGAGGIDIYNVAGSAATSFIGPAGTGAIGASALATGTVAFDVIASSTSTSAQYGGNSVLTVNTSGATSSSAAGHRGRLVTSTSNSNSGSGSGLLGEIETGGGGTGGYALSAGVRGTATQTASSNISYLCGLSGQAIVNGNTGSVARAIGVLAEPASKGGTMLFGAYGFYNRNQTNGNGANNNWAFYSEGGRCEIISAATGTILMQLQEASGQTANMFRIVNSSSVAQFNVAAGGVTTINPRDAGTNATLNSVIIGHNSSGTPATNFGTALLFQLESSTTEDRNASRISTFWTNATDATRSAALIFETVDNAAALAERVRIPAIGGLVVGTAALNTTATDGFLYIPSCAGTPSGVPTASTGTVPMVYDSTNNVLYVYSGGAWQAH